MYDRRHLDDTGYSLTLAASALFLIYVMAGFAV